MTKIVIDRNTNTARIFYGADWATYDADGDHVLALCAANGDLVVVYG